MALLVDLIKLLDDTLSPQLFKDYCPNGLQVEGASEVNKIVLGVTACQSLIDAAIERKADAILVHHGYFWRNEMAQLVGMKKERIKSLLTNDISLIAYHLPLDVHPLYGNNVQLAQRLGISVDGGLEPDNPRSVGSFGCLAQSMSGESLASHIEKVLGRKPLHITPERGDVQREITQVAWCTGGAQSYIDKAVVLGVDAYITGEVSEATVHTAREMGIHFFAAGHHATERYGVQALGKMLAEKMGVITEFVDIDNPV